MSQSIQVNEFYRALALIDPFIPEEARFESAGVKLEALHSLVKKQHISEDEIVKLRVILNRLQKSTGKSNIWLKISLTFIYAAVGAMTTRKTIKDQKQHQIPVCILSRFSDYVDKENSSQRFRNPRLSELSYDHLKFNFKLHTNKTEFLYPIYGMNEPAVEAFFQQIESIAWAPDNEFHQLFRQVALIILQHVRNFTEPSYSNGKFKYIFNKLEETFSNIKHQRVEIVNTDEKFPISLKYMQREVVLANKESMIIAPLTKNKIIVFHDYLTLEEINKGIQIARRGSIKIPLLREESIHGLSFKEVFQ